MNSLSLMEGVPVSNVGEAFGRLAASYDEDFESLPASQRLRRIIWKVYRRYFSPGDSVLELNCGTGTDALALASSGIKIHATDISREMLARFQEKLPGAQHKDLVTTQVLPFDRLSTLHGRRFDGAYSNMGGLNCERDLKRVADDLSPLVKPGGIFIGTFLGDIALWEMLAFLLRGNVAQAFRRRNSNGVNANVAGSIVRTFYYSPDAVRRHFSQFRQLEILGVNIFTPPPTSQQAYRKLGKGMRLLERLDDAIMNSSPFSRIGDHFIIVLKKLDKHDL